MNGWAEGYGSGSWRGYKWAFSVYPTDIYGKQTGSIGYTCLALGGSKDAELGTSSGTRFYKYEYKEPAIHIGILNFSPFEEQPIFYSRNLLMDVVQHRIYSSKFAVKCVRLITYRTGDAGR